MKNLRKRWRDFVAIPLNWEGTGRLVIGNCYKRRMQIEHGFRDIKSCFGFGKLVLKKPTHQRVAVFLFFLAIFFAIG